MTRGEDYDLYIRLLLNDFIAETLMKAWYMHG